MPERILLFPSFSDEMLKKVRFQKTKYSFFFRDRDGFEKELQDEPVETLSSIHRIKDESGEWDQDRNDFGLRRKYSLRTFQCLFGPSGIACQNAAIGMAIVWKSADSKQRGVVPIGTFTNNDQVFDASVEKVFGKAQLRGRVDFTTVLYIAVAGKRNDKERHLANTVGYILGELETFSLLLDGIGSTFPVFEVTEPGQPLWYVRCDWIDPTVDAFSECVSVNLNTAHKNYKFIDRTQASFCGQLLSEIMASAISIIIEKLRPSGYWDQIIGNDTLEDGSVGQAIYYFIDALGWDISSPEAVSLSARKHFDQRM